MRQIVLALALALAACASSPKRSAAPEPAGPVFILGAEEPYVVLDAPGWHRSPGTEKDQLMLHWHDHAEARFVAVWIKDADPGSTVEAAMTGFAAMLVAIPTLFSQVQATPVTALSDEEATFGFRGVDSKTGKRLVALCRVKLVSGHGVDYWAMLLSYGPEEDAPQMTFEADAIARSLRILPRTPSK